ncbi:hypothetical protein BU16DRAFT_543925 [Lophium mytilinum]|uniref:Uncharacterized protein n=1 Tax=Lophium mytilinum TaxID=390894 RepID=A0A6A6QES3_9PEZI|nr:hypothetical protein BU16DRAFT_543925 [Lophium mytilinum]
MTTDFLRPRSTEVASATPTSTPGASPGKSGLNRNIAIVVFAVLLTTVIVVVLCIHRRRLKKAEADIERGYEDESGFHSIPLHWLQGPGVNRTPSSPTPNA